MIAEALTNWDDAYSLRHFLAIQLSGTGHLGLLIEDSIAVKRVTTTKNCYFVIFANFEAVWLAKNLDSLPMWYNDFWVATGEDVINGKVNGVHFV